MISILLFFALSLASTGMYSERPAAINCAGFILEFAVIISTTAVDRKTDNSQLFLGLAELVNLSVSVCPSTTISTSFSVSSTLAKSINAFLPSVSTTVLPELNNNFASRLQYDLEAKNL